MQAKSNPTSTGKDARRFDYIGPGSDVHGGSTLWSAVLLGGDRFREVNADAGGENLALCPTSFSGTLEVWVFTLRGSRGRSGDGGCVGVIL